MSRKLELEKKLNILDSEYVLPFKTFQRSEVTPVTVHSSSKGNQKKWVTRDRKFYIKECFRCEDQVWQDNLVEIIASRYAGSCSLPRGVQVVQQGLCKISGTDASYSVNFNPERKLTSTLCRQLDSIYGNHDCPYEEPEEIFRWLQDVFFRITGIDCSGYILTAATLDLIVLNEDRHLNNWLFLQQGDRLVPAALFDFGLGLFEHDTVYQGTPLRECYSYTDMKPFARNPLRVLEFLTQGHSDFLSKFLPKYVDYTEYSFPSPKAGSYFIFMNRRLGVDVRNC